MSVLKNKIDFALVFTVRNANPNGDPIDGNRPRTTYEGFGEVSDVCLKRKIRNRLIDEGQPIFVQSDDRRAEGDNFRSLNDRANGNAALAACRKEMEKNSKTKEDFIQIACNAWFDVRAFGQVFAFKSKKKGDDGEGADAVSIGIRGPVSIQPAFSLRPVNITSTQITKSVNLETGADPDKKGNDTMGMKHRVDFGVYVTYGSINVQTSSKTGFDDDDAEILKNALQTLFRNDATSARPDGSMEVVKVIWWKHSCPNGNLSSAKVHRSLNVALEDNGEIREITVGALPAEIETQVLDGE